LKVFDSTFNFFFIVAFWITCVNNL
jgi:hypothetical protein